MYLRLIDDGDLKATFAFDAYYEAGATSSIVATVISVSDGWAVADCGLKALGMDHGDPTVIGNTVWYCSDEHVTFGPETPVAVGDRVRVVARATAEHKLRIVDALKATLDNYEASAEELQAGIKNADVVNTSDTGHYVFFKRQELLARYTPAGAERRTHRHFAAADGGLGKVGAGEVGAGDEEDEGDRQLVELEGEVDESIVSEPETCLR